MYFLFPNNYFIFPSTVFCSLVKKHTCHIGVLYIVFSCKIAVVSLSFLFCGSPFISLFFLLTMLDSRHRFRNMRFVYFFPSYNVLSRLSFHRPVFSFFETTDCSLYREETTVTVREIFHSF